MRPFFFILIIISILFFPASVYCQAIKVEIKKEKNQYALYRGGEPYFIKGAGGIDHLEKLKECGGNSIRLWNTNNAQYYLDKAHELGLTVTLGLFLHAERMGFDYNNEEEVLKQREEIKQEILKYKDHPALLIWGIGNEVELESSNPKMWDAINDISKMIHQLDSNHLTTTMLAGVPMERFPTILKRTGDLDLISINTFKDLPYVPDKIEQTGWKKPYLISEFGADGYWEIRQTEWNTFYELSSSEKAEQYKSRYQNVILKNSHKCIGSYVFFWGQKQERTHTYFSMILDKDKETEAVEVMQYFWTGKWPEERAPKIKSLVINRKRNNKDIFLKPGSVNRAKVITDSDDIYYYWELYHESTELRNDGKGEEKPEMILNSIKDSSKKEIEFLAPDKEGAYRLFVTIYRKNKVATANYPFYVN